MLSRLKSKYFPSFETYAILPYLFCSIHTIDSSLLIRHFSQIHKHTLSFFSLLHLLSRQELYMFSLTVCAPFTRVCFIMEKLFITSLESWIMRDGMMKHVNFNFLMAHPHGKKPYFLPHMNDNGWIINFSQLFHINLYFLELFSITTYSMIIQIAFIALSWNQN